jgi:two-component system, NarL family, sensor kinase
MYFLQAQDIFGINPVAFGSSVMLSLTFVVVAIVLLNQRKALKFDLAVKRIEEEKQKALLKASIRFQEEERNRIAADLHDDAGPLLATVRLYLNDTFINQPKAEQLQTIYSAKQIIDEAIGLIRNISHKLMPPTLRNFGLESACSDLFQKINGSGVIKSTARFHDYTKRLTPENEMLCFRVVQELVNNILKHSHAGFINLVQNATEKSIFIRINHDGTGITQAQFEDLSFSSKGLGLRNIDSRMRVLGGAITFDLDETRTFYKITLELPKEGETLELEPTSKNSKNAKG